MAIQFQDVSFGYRRRRPPVLDHFNWVVPAGRTVLLGPNGAGKSTVLALGADLERPWTGQIRLTASDKHDRRRYRSAVGWMPQTVRVIPGLTALEQVSYSGWLKGMSRVRAAEAAQLALEAVDLDDRAEIRTSELSGGQLRRVGLAQVLVHEPTVLLLDEPTVGLDPAQRSRFRDILSSLPVEQSVVVSTHQVDDLDELFDSVLVLDTGRLLWAGTVTEFLASAPSGAGERRAESAYRALVSGDG